MVQREPAILRRMRSAPGAGAQIRDQFFQLEPAALYLDQNQNSAGQRAHQKIETIGRGAMFRAAGLEGDMPFQPAAFQDQPGCGCELAKIFAQETRRFVREKPIARRRRRCVGRGQQFTGDTALFIDRKQILFQAKKKIFRLPFREGRADPKTGKGDALPKRFAGSGESVLQPRFQ